MFLKVLHNYSKNYGMGVINKKSPKYVNGNTNTIPFIASHSYMFLKL